MSLRPEAGVEAVAILVGVDRMAVTTSVPEPGTIALLVTLTRRRRS